LASLCDGADSSLDDLHGLKGYWAGEIGSRSLLPGKNVGLMAGDEGVQGVNWCSKGSGYECEGEKEEGK